MKNAVIKIKIDDDCADVLPMDEQPALMAESDLFRADVLKDIIGDLTRMYNESVAAMFGEYPDDGRAEYIDSGVEVVEKLLALPEREYKVSVILTKDKGQVEVKIETDEDEETAEVILGFGGFHIGNTRHGNEKPDETPEEKRAKFEVIH